jgi:predicted Ser/Thr protein kinase
VTAHSGQPGQIAGSVLPLKKAEELLSTLQDVVSARIVSDAHGSIDSIHVLVMGTSTPKQVVRNIESALMAQLGMRVDHRKISVATTVKRPTTNPEGEAAADAKRAPIVESPSGATGVTRSLYFEDVEVRGSRAKGVACKVTLRRGKEQFVGEAEGFESERSRVEIAARAALAAIALCDGGEMKMSYEGGRLIDAFDRQLVLVGISVRQARGSVFLTGSCEVKDSLETASALAVLNATNRWVEGVR